jgi:hypothetical protein
MKKTLLLLGLVVLFGAACQKEYTCVCITENPLGGDDIEIPHELEKTTKSKAEDACQRKEDEENSSSSAPTTSCKLE